MQTLIIIGGLILCLLICISGPLAAMADCKDIVTQPKQRCGLHCVIETRMCETKEEADEFFLSLASVFPTASKPYQPKGSDKWFVDYQLTEFEANMM